MFKTVRAAAFAAAAIAFAGAALWGGPVRAQADEGAAPTAYYLDHGSASVAAFSRDLGLNDEADAPAETRAPAPGTRSLDDLISRRAANRSRASSRLPKW
jgi:hypothetical protein